MVFQTDTIAGRRFDKILLLIILASLVTVILDSIDEVHQSYAGLLAAIEWGFTAIFLAEYITLLDQPLAGLLIIIGILIAKHYAAMWAVIASAIGGGVALMADQGQAAWMGLYGFNAALAALAFSRQCEAPWIPLLAIALALLLQALISLLPVAGLTAPFVVACWMIHATETLSPGSRRVAN
jgi:urea transporter